MFKIRCPINPYHLLKCPWGFKLSAWLCRNRKALNHDPWYPLGAETNIPLQGASQSVNEIKWTTRYSGWWYTYPSEQYKSQSGWFFPIYGEKENFPNHQPDIYIYIAYPQWGQRAIHRLYIGYMVFVSAESLNSSASHNASDLAIGSWALGPFQHDFLGEHDVIGHWEVSGCLCLNNLNKKKKSRIIKIKTYQTY